MPAAVHISLDHPRAPWQTAAGGTANGLVVYARGYARHGRRRLEGQHLADHIAQLAASDTTPGRDQLTATIPQLDGGWALVVQWPDGKLLAATDRLRTIPVFWSLSGERFTIADAAERCATAGSASVDELAALEFVLLSYVTGEQTLYRDVHQLPAGQWLVFDPCDTRQPVRQHTYYRFYPAGKDDLTESDFEEQLEHVLDAIFDDFVADFGDSRVLLPLSGGLDSRLIAAQLKKRGLQNVLCFTYGERQLSDVEISKQVADALGYDWHFVPYDGQLWQRWNRDPRYWDFCRFACKGCSTPLIQDLPAVVAIHEQGLCDASSIFFPGHSADMVAGSHIPSHYTLIEEGKKSLEDEILDGQFTLWPIPTSSYRRPPLDSLREKIGITAAPPATSTWASVNAQSELWNALCRQPLYIVNGVRAYEWVGARWRTLWNYPLMDFFLRVPLPYRFGRRLYVNVLRSRIFTGAAADLAQIPLAGLADWSSRTGLKQPARKRDLLWRRAKHQLRRASRSLRGLPSTYRPTQRANYFLNDVYTRLYGEGIDAASSTVEDVLRLFGSLERLPPGVREQLQPFFEHRPHDVWWRGLFAAQVLADYLGSQPQSMSD